MDQLKSIRKRTDTLLRILRMVPNIKFLANTLWQPSYALLLAEDEMKLKEIQDMPDETVYKELCRFLETPDEEFISIRIALLTIIDSWETIMAIKKDYDVHGLVRNKVWNDELLDEDDEALEQGLDQRELLVVAKAIVYRAALSYLSSGLDERFDASGKDNVTSKANITT
ncbi:hypothetical protein BKA67DRAFT_533768 [Truncatella angustata]|uniref:Uncharacterized protein n=1 Tax=Truncatella angustata TaxID=152316 RepID=A0A9P9A2W6_9PEZI|nr:uncharacterized protein BKA67DRAFT_533768 [Truncatella angustata]KAH6658641.1 hypothetical protein BKA67DRAFT_533768 [Truncatella angustata]